MKIDVDDNWLIVKYSDDVKYLIRMDTVISVEKSDTSDSNPSVLCVPQIIIVTAQKEYKLRFFDNDVPGCEKWESRDRIFNKVQNAILQYPKENRSE